MEGSHGDQGTRTYPTMGMNWLVRPLLQWKESYRRWLPQRSLFLCRKRLRRKFPLLRTLPQISGASSHASDSSTARPECQESIGDEAAALMMGVTPEEDVLLGLKDMPPLEEAPPPHFSAARSPPKKKAKPEPCFYPG